MYIYIYIYIYTYMNVHIDEGLRLISPLPSVGYLRMLMYTYMDI